MRWFLVLLLFINFTVPTTYGGELLAQDAKIFTQMRDHLFKICTKDGKFLFNTIIKVKDGTDELAFNCNAHLAALKDMHEAMRLKKLEAKETGKLCEPVIKSNLAASSVVIINQVKPALSELNSCEKKSSDLTCSGAFACAMVAGPFNGLLKKVHVKNRKLQSVINECSDMKGYECIGSALRGVWDNLSISAQAIWKLLGMMKDGAAWTGGKLYDVTIGSVIGYFSKVEEATSDKLLVASSMPPSVWEQFKSDPVKVSKELAAGFMKVLTDGIKSHYGCEKWSGVPFASECLVPMQDWDCATCNQKMNSICGVLGFAGGELLVAYLTGGATVAAKKVVQYSYKGGTALFNKVMEPVKAFRLSIHNRVASEVIDTTVKATGEVAGTAYKVSMKMKLRDFLEVAGKVTYKAGSKVLNSKVFTIVAKSTKMVLTPIRKYIQLTDWAFMRGYEHVGRAFQSVESKVFPKMVSFVSKYDAANPAFVRFISDKEIGINIKTYGSYVAALDRGNRGRDNQSKKDLKQAQK